MCWPARRGGGVGREPGVDAYAVDSVCMGIDRDGFLVMANLVIGVVFVDNNGGATGLNGLGSGFMFDK